jgi:hypothetical protein
VKRLSDSVRIADTMKRIEISERNEAQNFTHETFVDIVTREMLVQV